MNAEDRKLLERTLENSADNGTLIHGLIALICHEAEVIQVAGKYRLVLERNPSKPELLAMVNMATKILKDGLKYHEYDGHNMSKKVARDALEALGIPRNEQS